MHTHDIHELTYEEQIAKLSTDNALRAIFDTYMLRKMVGEKGAEASLMLGLVRWQEAKTTLLEHINNPPAKEQIDAVTSSTDGAYGPISRELFRLYPGNF